MLEGPIVFLDVDTQRDFLDPDGRLYVPGSDAIRPTLARLSAFAREHSIPVLATSCAHEPGDPEFDTFPPHCLVGTVGQERIPETASPGFILEPGNPIPTEISAHLTVHKRAYDVFTHPGADAVVALYSRDRPTFVVYGVATDYCVRAAVEGLLARGQKVAIVADAIRAVDASSEPAMLTAFANAGALLTLADVVCAN